MQDSLLTLYKLIVLFMLNEVKFPLKRSQLFEFILEREYCTFFSLQQAIGELLDSKLIQSKAVLNGTQLSITEEGKSTLKYFANRLEPSIQEDIRHFMHQNKLNFKNEVSIQSDYFKSTSGEYTARLFIKEELWDLIHIELSVPTEEGAKKACRQWKEKHEEIYGYIMEQLL